MKTFQGQRSSAKPPAKAKEQKKQTVQVRLRRWQAILNLVEKWDAFHRIEDGPYKYHLPKDKPLSHYIAKRLKCSANDIAKDASLADYIATYYDPGKLPTVDDLAMALLHQGFKACGRTVRNDIQDIQEYWGSNIIGYDEQAHGYRLGNEREHFAAPLLSTSGMQATIMCQKMMAPLLPSYLQVALEDARQIEHAMIDPKDFNADAAEAFAMAPSPQISHDKFNEIFRVVMDACKLSRQLAIRYSNRNSKISDRVIDPHALFVSEGAWYVRAYCHNRKAVISLAVHRMETPELLATTFKRDPLIADEIRAGKCFDYETITDIVLEVSRSQAKAIGDRNWFCREPGGEEKIPIENGRLKIKIRRAYEQPLIRWILGYGGAVVAKQPLSLRQKVKEAAEAIVKGHAL